MALSLAHEFKPTSHLASIYQACLFKSTSAYYLFDPYQVLSQICRWCRSTLWSGWHKQNDSDQTFSSGANPRNWKPSLSEISSPRCQKDDGFDMNFWYFWPRILQHMLVRFLEWLNLQLQRETMPCSARWRSWRHEGDSRWSCHDIQYSTDYVIPRVWTDRWRARPAAGSKRGTAGQPTICFIFNHILGHTRGTSR